MTVISYSEVAFDFCEEPMKNQSHCHIASALGYLMNNLMIFHHPVGPWMTPKVEYCSLPTHSPFQRASVEHLQQLGSMAFLVFHPLTNDDNACSQCIIFDKANEIYFHHLKFASSLQIINTFSLPFQSCNAHFTSFSAPINQRCLFHNPSLNSS